MMMLRTHCPHGHPLDGRNSRGWRYCKTCKLDIQRRYRLRSRRTKYDRFWDKVRKTSDCWLWEACTDRHGYGQMRWEGRLQMAHRVSWKIANGPITDRLCVLHHCDNPICIRPDHLFSGTKMDNLQDCVRKGRARHPGTARGERHGKSVLTDDKVLSIRSMHEEGVNYSMLALLYGVSKQSIRQIILRDTWTHI